MGMSDNQVTGAIGSQIERRQELQRQLEEITISLCAQSAAIKSIKAKISLMEKASRRDPNGQIDEQFDRERKMKLAGLRDLFEQLEYSFLW